MPRADDPVQFATQVEPLFRQKDRQSMRRHFDLGSYEDVSAYADRILKLCGPARCLVMGLAA